jgi:hypothetical protein
MTIQVEISDAGAARSISHTLPYTHILRLSTMERLLKEPIHHNFKQVEVEEDPAKFMPKPASKRRTVWTHLFKEPTCKS